MKWMILLICLVGCTPGIDAEREKLRAENKAQNDAEHKAFLEKESPNYDAYLAWSKLPEPKEMWLGDKVHFPHQYYIDRTGVIVGIETGGIYEVRYLQGGGYVTCKFHRKEISHATMSFVGATKDGSQTYLFKGYVKEWKE